MSKSTELSGASVDVVLLAIVIALHVTRKNENLKLILIVLIMVHVIATTRRLVWAPDSNIKSATAADANGPSPAQPVPLETLETLGAPPKLVTSAGYDRQFTSPSQLAKTRDVLPSTSEGANGKLVASRTRFFKDIID